MVRKLIFQLSQFMAVCTNYDSHEVDVRGSQIHFHSSQSEHGQDAEGTWKQGREPVIGCAQYLGQTRKFSGWWEILVNI